MWRLENISANDLSDRSGAARWADKTFTFVAGDYVPYRTPTLRPTVAKYPSTQHHLSKLDVNKKHTFNLSRAGRRRVAQSQSHFQNPTSEEILSRIWTVGTFEVVNEKHY